ncbi:hypothetical protein [Lapillicoccus sp.]|uniref:hypothetical protein n=1 Tax=Lapillicoccus sp. TaxID=1909287 RepID=UPI00326437A2
MTKHAPGPRALALAGLAIAALLTGCTSPGSSTPGTMMGGQADSTTPGTIMGGQADSSTPGTMMGGQADYHFSPLSCAAPASRPGTTVTVVLADMGMTQMMGGDAPMGARMMLHATPGAVAQGQVSLVAENLGWRTHELVVLPLGQTAAAGQRVPDADGKVDESGSLGEASASCAGGSGTGIDSAAVGWVTIHLAPGRYELVCNLKNHYANGMYQELDVR